MYVCRHTRWRRLAFSGTASPSCARFELERTLSLSRARFLSLCRARARSLSIISRGASDRQDLVLAGVALVPVNPYTPHPTPYTLHPTPYTLHPTPYTQHPTPYPLHPKR